MPFDYVRIREFRKRLGFTQVALAERLGVPQPTVARWESGQVSPCADYIGAMCDLGRVKGIDPSFFFPAFSRYDPQQDRDKIKPDCV
ncbi:MAG: helix-turn-helix domain-containing protein [Candidatus Latescibacterota bacterium]